MGCALCVSSRRSDSPGNVVNGDPSSVSSKKACEVLITMKLEAYSLDASNRLLLATLFLNNHMFELSDPWKTDCPIVFASDAFCSYTQYALKDIKGINCRFLQGPKTTPESVDKIRVAIKSKKRAAVFLLNYKKDGSMFYNHFFITPLNDNDQQCVLFLGIQTSLKVITPQIEAMAATEYLEALMRQAPMVS